MIIPRQPRVLFLLTALACTGLIGFALFLQHVKGLEPCPLCISQRLVVIAIGLTALIGALHNPRRGGYKVYGLITAFFGISGAALAIRQLWLQQLPPEQVPSCMPSLQYLMDVLPFTEVVRIMLSGTGDCAQVQWVFLGLPIPGWTLVAFTGFTLFGLYQYLIHRSR